MVDDEAGAKFASNLKDIQPANVSINDFVDLPSVEQKLYNCQVQLEHQVSYGHQTLQWLANWFRSGLQLIEASKQTNNSALLYEHLHSNLEATLAHIKDQRVASEMGRALSASVESVVSDQLARLLTFL